MRKSLKLLFLIMLLAVLTSALYAQYPNCSGICGGDDWELGAALGNFWQAAKSFLGF